MTSAAQSLALWGHAWATGAVPADDALSALAQWSIPGCSGNGLDTLTRLRDMWESGGELRLVLPAFGDVRGLPLDADFADTAMTEGSCVLVGQVAGAGVGFVRDTSVSCAFGHHDIVMPNDAYAGMTLRGAEFALREATREASRALQRFHAIEAGDPVGARQMIDDALADFGEHVAPPTISDRAHEVLDTADRVDAILIAAQRLYAPTPSSATATLAREDALRPLLTKVREARMAAVNSELQRR